MIVVGGEYTFTGYSVYHPGKSRVRCRVLRRYPHTYTETYDIQTQGTSRMLIAFVDELVELVEVTE